jgi:hypothetical protein
MVVLAATVASRYHNCCIDGGTSPEYFGYHLVGVEGYCGTWSHSVTHSLGHTILTTDTAIRTCNPTNEQLQTSLLPRGHRRWPDFEFTSLNSNYGPVCRGQLGDCLVSISDRQSIYECHL